MQPSIDGTEKSVRLCYSGLQIQGTANSPPITAKIGYHNSFKKATEFVRQIKRCDEECGSCVLRKCLRDVASESGEQGKTDPSKHCFDD